MHLNPEMLLEIAQEYLRHCAADPEAADPASPGVAVLSKATKLLTLLVSQVRGGGGRRGKRARGQGARRRQPPPPAGACTTQ